MGASKNTESNETSSVYGLIQNLAGAINNVAKMFRRCRRVPTCNFKLFQPNLGTVLDLFSRSLTTTVLGNLPHGSL